MPAALSNSYLMGSPPIGTSISTLTSCGGFAPTLMESNRMHASRRRRQNAGAGASERTDRTNPAHHIAIDRHETRPLGLRSVGGFVLAAHELQQGPHLARRGGTGLRLDAA